MKKLDVYLSNLAVANTYLHNLHWNLSGDKAFKEAHVYLEDLYTQAFEYFDEVAELQIMLGQKPLSSMNDYMNNATLKDLEKTEFTVTEALEHALEYIKLMKELTLEVREQADEEGTFVIANMMEDHYTEYIKHEWFLSSMLK